MRGERVGTVCIADLRKVKLRFVVLYHLYQRRRNPAGAVQRRYIYRIYARKIGSQGGTGPAVLRKGTVQIPPDLRGSGGITEAGGNRITGGPIGRYLQI